MRSSPCKHTRVAVRPSEGGVRSTLGTSSHDSCSATTITSCMLAKSPGIGGTASPHNPCSEQCNYNAPLKLGWAIPTQIGISPPGLAMDAFPAMRPSPRSRTPAPCHCDDGPFVVVMCTVETKCTVLLNCLVVYYYDHCNGSMGPGHRNCLHRFRQTRT